MADYILSGLRALDLTDEKGFICGKILATLGVDVIKIEKPGGDESRNIPPFYQDTPNPEKSLYWAAFNTDKRSITLNLETNRGQEIFKKLVESSDFVIESFTPGYMDILGLGYDVLSKLNPRIIMTSITYFGQKGPYSRYKGSELILSAMSGVMANCGDPDRPPVREGPDSIYFRGNSAAAFGTILSHYYREITGEGQQVDVSLHEVDVSRNTVNQLFWEFDKRLEKRSGPMRILGARSTKWIWSCKDGYLFWTLSGGMLGSPANRAISKWLEEDGIENPLGYVTRWEELDMAKLTPETIEAFEEAIATLFMKHTKKEIAEEGLRRGINTTVVNNPADVLDHLQLWERDYWVELEYPKVGVMLKYPKHFFLASETDNFVKHRAPLIGENNEEIYNKELCLSIIEITALKEANVI